MSVHDLQAPSQDGAILVHPPLDCLEDSLHQARTLLAGESFTFEGTSLSGLRTRARQETVDQVRAYYRETGEPVDLPISDAWLVGGHQPELFHPGVWLKNFFLAGQAKRFGALALNLVVDNDIARQPILRVPGTGQILSFPFDAGRSESPYEERNVQDETLFNRLPKSVLDSVGGWPFRPLLVDFWIDVYAQSERTRNLGERLVRARRAWERRWGIQPIELPVSRLAQIPSYRLFLKHILFRADAFREAYNAAVHAYRQRYGLKSKNHPVPDLASDGVWHEVPFWCWRSGTGRRGRLYAHRQGDVVHLRCEKEPLTAFNVSDAVAKLGELEQQGWKIRPRALSLTLFVRLFLSDVFVHGLGGGKYDEVTDAILRSFFAVSPPPFLVVTGTLRLPLPRHEVSEHDLMRLQWRRRDLIFNPQRHIPARTRLSPRDHEILMTKAVLMRYVPHRHKERKDRFFQMRHLNEDLQHLVADQTRETRKEIHQTERALHHNAILGRRDYAFCLHPEDSLRRFVSQVLEASVAVS